MHELTHVYQYEQVGSRYLGEAIYILIKTKRDCYRYGGRDGLRAVKAKNGRFSDFNREQQAMIVQDYFTAMERGEETAVYTPFIEQARCQNLSPTLYTSNTLLSQVIFYECRFQAGT